MTASGNVDQWQSVLRELAARQGGPRGTLNGHTLLERRPFRLLKLTLANAEQVPEDQPPLLVVYSLVNRPDILDLTPQRSLLRQLALRGFPLYLVDWGYPIDADRCLDLEDYVPGFLGRAIEQVEAGHGRGRVVLVGVCQGGTLSLCQASLQPERISRLVLLGTPVDFHASSHPLAQLAQTLPRLDEPAPDNIPGAWLSMAFASLKPVDLLVRRYRKLHQLSEQGPDALDEFIRMETWMYDCPDQPGTLFHRFIREFYHENALIQDRLWIGGQPVRLERLTMPVLNVYARDDHLVPEPMAAALARAASATRVQDCVVPGGHLGLFLSRRSREHLLQALLDFVADNRPDPVGNRPFSKENQPPAPDTGNPGSARRG